jgi:hypothetical protein
MDDPWGHLPGGDPHPIVASPTAPYIPFGAFGSMGSRHQFPAGAAVERQAVTRDFGTRGCFGYRTMVASSASRDRAGHGSRQDCDPWRGQDA